MSNRRRAPRIPTEGEVLFAGLAGELIDLNQFGCQARFPHGIFVPESVLDLTIRLHDPKKPEVHTNARVVRFDTETRIAAFEFEEPPKEVEAFQPSLEELLSAHHG